VATGGFSPHHVPINLLAGNYTGPVGLPIVGLGKSVTGDDDKLTTKKRNKMENLEIDTITENIGGMLENQQGIRSEDLSDQEDYADYSEKTETTTARNYRKLINRMSSSELDLW
jgi:hypothetical protein